MGAGGGPESEDLVAAPRSRDRRGHPVDHVEYVFRGGTVIDIAWARLHGQGLRYGYDKLIRDKITGWEDPNDFIRWHLDVGRAGRYEVILQYGCGVADAGSRIRIASGDARIEFVVEPTSAVDVWRTQGVGFLGLKPGLTTLDIRVLSKPGKSVMDLHELRLRRVGETRSIADGVKQHAPLDEIRRPMG